MPPPKRHNIVIGCDGTPDPVLMGVIHRGDQVKFMSPCVTVELQFGDDSIFGSTKVLLDEGKFSILKVKEKAPFGPFLYKTVVLVQEEVSANGSALQTAAEWALDVHHLEVDESIRDLLRSEGFPG